MTAALEVGFLGPLEVRVGRDTRVTLGGLRQRALLAVLALSANQVISTDRLVDELWGETPPTTANHTVQVFVSRLRGALGPAAERLLTRPPGYVLELDDAELDARVCERLYESARASLAAGDAADAARKLRGAGALWRGPPLADFTYEPFAQAAIARLEELRVTCREELIEAELALGMHVDVVPQLEALVREHPYRERPRAQLMLALYRSGRQADALDAFQDARRVLTAELAVEPGKPLRELEQAILQQDPALTLPGPSGAPPDVAESPAPEPAADAEPPTVAGTSEATGAESSAGSLLRKLATILVGKLVADRPDADAEVVRRAVAEARVDADAIVRRHGGVPVIAMAGELVWVFGMPATKEDDALRAVRAADEIAGALSSVSGEPRRGLTVRLAIAGGEIVAKDTSDLFGDPLERGLSMARAATAGDVVLDEATRHSVLSVAEIEPARDANVWRLTGLADEGAVTRRTSPIVDRTRELAAGLEVVDLARRSREAQLMTLVGEAGIGKSRLVQELSDRLAGNATVLTGRCLSYGEGIAFWPWRDALAQITGGESPDALRTLLEGAPDADMVASIIATTVRLAPAESVSEQVPWAFRRLLEVLAIRRPVLLVIEDAHWADPALLELIEYLVDWLRAPVTILALARPELLEARPSWGGGHPRMRSVVLAPLEHHDARALLDQRQGRAPLEARLRDEILRTAEGNPLFVEQLLEAQAEDPVWDRDRQVPATIQSLLAARLDRLGPGERAVIERAALIGREFWPDAVTELLPPEARASVPSHLRTLVHRGLIRPEASILAGQEQLSFQHILIRDVAYSSSPKAVRASLHERFAAWLQERGPGVDEFIGYHYEQAYRYRDELDPSDAQVVALAARGGEFLAAAGRRALYRGDANAGVKLLTSSAELIEASGGRRPDVLLDLGGALSEIDVPRAEPALRAAHEQALALGNEALAARALIELSYRRAVIDRTVPVSEMLSVAEEAVRVFTRMGDDGGIARAWHHVAMVHWHHLQCAEMERILDRALTHAEEAGDHVMEARVLGFLARATVAGPRPVDDGRRRCQAILDRAGEDIGLVAVTETMLSVLDGMQGRFPAARRRWQAAKRQLEAVGLSVTVAKLQMYCAFVELLAGTPENAEPELAAACEVLQRRGERGHLNSTAGLMARLLWAHGRHDDAERYCRMSEETGTADDVVSEILWRGTKAKLLALGGDGAGSGDLADSAVALAERTDFLLLHAYALSDRAEAASLHGGDGRADRAAAEELLARKGIHVGSAGALDATAAASASASASD